MAKGDQIRVGTCTDVHGDVITIDVSRRGSVFITFAEGEDGEDGFSQMDLGAPEREQFQRLFMEAERQAEAWAAAHPQEAS